MTYPDRITACGIECQRVETLPRGAAWQSRGERLVLAVLYYPGLASVGLAWTVSAHEIVERAWGREPRVVASATAATLAEAEAAVYGALLVHVVEAATARAA